MKAVIRLCASCAAIVSIAGCATENQIARNTARVLGADQVSIQYYTDNVKPLEGMKYRALADGREYECFTQLFPESVPICKPAQPMFDPSRFTPLENLRRR